MAYDMLCPKPLGVKNQFVVDDHRFGDGVDGSSLAEYSQLFWLHEQIQAGDIVADDLFLFQYRKFISPNKGGAPSTAPWVRMLTPQEGPLLFPTPEQFEVLGSRVITGSELNFGESISTNYARVHVVDDWAMFVAACSECGVLAPEDVKALTTLHVMIPSPAVCYTHVDLFMKIMELLQRVWKYYYPRYHVVRTGYQRRVAGYLFERLHSYLLCKWLLDGTEPDIRIWQRYVVMPPEPTAAQTTTPEGVV